MSPFVASASNTLRMTARAPRLSLRGVRWQHPDGHNPFPFNYKNKAAFRAKYISVLGFGFALPFVASYWQLRKSAAASA